MACYACSVLTRWFSSVYSGARSETPLDRESKHYSRCHKHFQALRKDCRVCPFSYLVSITGQQTHNVLEGQLDIVATLLADSKGHKQLSCQHDPGKHGLQDPPFSVMPNSIRRRAGSVRFCEAIVTPCSVLCSTDLLGLAGIENGGLCTLAGPGCFWVACLSVP